MKQHPEFEQRLTLQHLWQTAVRLYSDTPAFGSIGEEPFSYREFASRIRRTASRLTAAGIGRGDRVALLSENRPEWPVAYFAINHIGAVIVPILPDFSPAEIGNILSHSGSTLLVTSEEMRKRLPADAPDMQIQDIAQLATDSYADGDSAVTVEPDDIACIIYTSGTTGSSKGVVLTNRNLSWNAIEAGKLTDMRPGERHLGILPLAHTYECTIGMLMMMVRGMSIWYLKRPPSVSVLLPALSEIRPHAMCSVPLLIEKIYRSRVAPQFRGDSLTARLYRRPLFRKLLSRIAVKKLISVFGGRMKYFGIGGAPLDPAVERFLHDGGFPYAIGYGLTETSPLISGIGPGKQQPGATGPVLGGLEVRLSNQNEDGIGDIEVRGPSIMVGYYREPEKSAEVLSEDGWFSTGDRGAWSRDGYLAIRGRTKTMILGPSGENIYPEAIEAVIDNQEFVEESLVYEEENRGLVARVRVNYEALQDYLARIGDSVKNRAADTPEAISDFLAELRRRVNAQLSSFSRLQQIIPQDEPFVRTPTRKIKRFLYTGEGGKPEAN